MAEGRGNQVRHRQIDVGVRRDDDGVLARGLGEQFQVRLPVLEQASRLGRAGQHDAVGPGDQTPTDVGAPGPDELQRIGGHPRRPRTLGDDLGATWRPAGRLEDHRIAGSE